MAIIEGKYDPRQRPLAEVAYNIEGEEILVAKAQAEGKLVHHVAYFNGAEKITEEMLSWFRVTLNGMVCNLFSGSVNEEALMSLKPRQDLLVVYAANMRADFSFGRPEFPLAALITADDNFVYKSSGFTWDSYQPIIERPDDPRIKAFYSGKRRT